MTGFDSSNARQGGPSDFNEMGFLRQCSAVTVLCTLCTEKRVIYD